MIAAGRARWALAAVAIGAAVGTTVVACGARTPAGDRIAGKRLTIYVSLPLSGPSSLGGRAVLKGARLALDAIHRRIGRYRIALKAYDDATVPSRGWDPGQTTVNARLAVSDNTTVGYIGELDSGASAVSIPLLNRAGIAQISPSSTAVGLTTGGAAASPGEPQKYYPTGRRTFARVIPNDSVQGAVQAELQRHAGCRSTYVLHDAEVDGSDAAMSFEVAARATGLSVIGTGEFDPRATDYSALATSIAQTGADCVLISALAENNAGPLTTQVARAMPEAQMFGSAGLAASAYTDPAHGGVALGLDSRIVITAATLDPGAYPPAGRRFFAGYASRYGAQPADAIYGYEATSLMLDAISRATGRGIRTATRSKVLAAIFATRDRASVLGVYGIDRAGDTTLDRYGVYRVRAGRLAFWKAITP